MSDFFKVVTHLLWKSMLSKKVSISWKRKCEEYVWWLKCWRVERPFLKRPSVGHWTVNICPFLCPQCSNCDSTSAACWCLDCNEALCTICVSAHRRVTVTRTHRLLHHPPEGKEPKAHSYWSVFHPRPTVYRLKAALMLRPGLKVQVLFYGLKERMQIIFSVKKTKSLFNRERSRVSVWWSQLMKPQKCILNSTLNSTSCSPS